jgi:hypothetical protein
MKDIWGKIPYYCRAKFADSLQSETEGRARFALKHQRNFVLKALHVNKKQLGWQVTTV